jgi:3-phosphoshikimate 1-carboxyvinyltransferase
MGNINAVEIHPVGNLDADIVVPGSKSYTQRALVAASLAHGNSVLHNVLLSEDTGHFIQALRALGANILISGGDITVDGTGGVLKAPEKLIHLGSNGTAMRFLASAACLAQGHVTLTGDARLCERPIRPLMTYLANLGVSFKYLKQEGFPPVEILAAGLKGGRLQIKNTESSQYISSLLLAAPYAVGPVSLVLEGDIVSRPYIDMTVQVMADFGVAVQEEKPGAYTVPVGPGFRGRDYIVEGDASSASYFFLAAMLCRGYVRVHNMNPNSRQGDMKLLDLIRDWGGEVTRGDHWIAVKGHKMKTGPLIVDMGDMPDMVPTAAVLAAFRDGVTEIRRVAHLRIKESNRLAALVTELGRIGIKARETADGLVITGGKAHGATIQTYNDHRIAMSFAVAGLVVPGITIENPRCVHKSFPEFWEVFGQLGGKLA